MRVHYILHASFEKLGAIESWLEKNQYKATSTHTYKGETLPDVSEFDLLIIMGGPQSAVHLDRYPYLQDEVVLAKDAIQANKAVLGVCLGAQLIGVALGAKAEPSPNREIGIYPVTKTAEAETDAIFKQFSSQFDVMHWHNDMPGLAPEAVLLASSAGCPRQAFRYGDRVYGFQFHMELTPGLIQKMAEHCAQDLEPAQYVQSADVLLQQDLTEINRKMHIALDYLAERVKTEK